MKILWFTNTPCGAAEKLIPDLLGGGWLKSQLSYLISHISTLLPTLNALSGSVPVKLINYCA